MEKRKHLGFNHWFQNRADNDKLASHKIARVISVHKDSYMIRKSDSDIITEITELSLLCKFSNCQHIKEKGCAIRAAINEDALPDERYLNYVKIKKESAFNERSFL